MSLILKAGRKGIMRLTYLLTIMPVEVTTEVKPLERVMVWAAPLLLIEFML